MKLKYYLRGMGIGVILTAIIMGFALGARNAPVSDAEVIEKAKGLGMVEGGVLSDYSGEDGSVQQTPDEPKAPETTDMSDSYSPAADNGTDLTGNIGSESALSGASTTDLVKVTDIKENSPVSNSAGGSLDKTTSSASSFKSTKTDEKDLKDNNKDKKTSDLKTESKVKEEEQESDEPEEEEESKEPEQQPDTTPAAPSTTPAVSSTTPAPAGEMIEITIPGGSGSDKVASILKDAGLVDDAVAFNKYLIQNKVDRKIRSGKKVFPANATYDQIADIIVR